MSLRHVLHRRVLRLPFEDTTRTQVIVIITSIPHEPFLLQAFQQGVQATQIALAKLTPRTLVLFIYMQFASLRHSLWPRPMARLSSATFPWASALTPIPITPEE